VTASEEPADLAVDPAGVPPRILPSARTAVLLGLLVVVAFVIRVDALRNAAPDVPAFGDDRAYHLLARNLADGKGYVRPYDLERRHVVVKTAEYPPALPLLLAGGDEVGVSGETGQRTLLCVVGAITVGLVGLIGRRLGGDVVGLLSAAIAAVHPAMVNADVSLAAEPLAMCLGAAVLLAALASHDRPGARRWVPLGVLLGVGCLVRAEFLLLVPLIIGHLAWEQRGGWRPRLRMAGVGLVAVAAVLVPWTVRNAVAFHRFVPVSNNLGSVLKGSNCGPAYDGQFRGMWVESLSTQTSPVDPDHECFTGFPIRPGVNEAAASAELRSDGLSYIRHHLGDQPGVVAARLGRTVGLYRFADTSNYARLEGRDATRERRGTRTFQVLAVLALVGLAAGGWRHRERLIPLALVGAVLVTVAVTYGNPRFRATAEPAVVVLAVLAVCDLVRRAASRPGDGQAEAPTAES
jgi:4-amino-4-deoxy-L-arabinose transferase-like glycosyltransferase